MSKPTAATRLPFDHESDGRRYILRWALDGRQIPRFVECYECDQPDAVFIPDLGYSCHVSNVWEKRDDAAAVGEQIVRDAITEQETRLAVLLRMRAL